MGSLPNNWGIHIMRVILIDGIEYTEYELLCPECGSNMVLRKSRFGLFYGCQEFEIEGCKGRISADKDGTPAELPSDQQTKTARIIAFECFEKLWKSGAMDKRTAFSWACDRMGRKRSNFNIANFTIVECETFINKINRRIRKCEYVYETSKDSEDT